MVENEKLKPLRRKILRLTHPDLVTSLGEEMIHFNESTHKKIQTLLNIAQNEEDQIIQELKVLGKTNGTNLNIPLFFYNQKEQKKGCEITILSASNRVSLINHVQNGVLDFCYAVGIELSPDISKQSVETCGIHWDRLHDMNLGLYQDETRQSGHYTDKNSSSNTRYSNFTGSFDWNSTGYPKEEVKPADFEYHYSQTAHQEQKPDYSQEIQKLEQKIQKRLCKIQRSSEQHHQVEDAVYFDYINLLVSKIGNELKPNTFRGISVTLISGIFNQSGFLLQGKHLTINVLSVTFDRFLFLLQEIAKTIRRSERISKILKITVSPNISPVNDFDYLETIKKIYFACGVGKRKHYFKKRNRRYRQYKTLQVVNEKSFSQGATLFISTELSPKEIMFYLKKYLPK